MHQRIEATRPLQEIVNPTEDTEHTEGEDPDPHDRDDGRLTTDEEAEETEEGGDDIDHEDGAGQLPRRDRVPEGTIGTRDEDEPVLREGDLQEEHLVADTEVLHDTAIVALGQHGRQRNPRADGQDDAQQDRHTPETGQVPLDRGLGEGGIVVGDGQGGDIGEDGDEDDEFQVQALVEDGDPQTQEDFQMQRERDTVDDVGVHAMEDLPGSLERVDDGRETGGEEDDVGGGAGRVRGTLDGDTRVGFLEGGRIVDTVTRHGHEVTTLLQDLDDVVFVLGENLREAVGGFDEIVDFRSGHGSSTAETETFGVVDIRSETELARGFTGDADGVTRQHLDGQSQGFGFVDGFGGIVTGRVHAGHDAEDFPAAFTTLAGDTEGAVATGCEIGDFVLVGHIDVFGDFMIFSDGFEDEEGCAFDTDDAFALRGLDSGGDLLGDRVEGDEFDDLVLGENALGPWVVSERFEESLVDGIDTLLLPGSGQTRSQHEIIGFDTSDGEWLGKGELVLRQCTSPVNRVLAGTTKITEMENTYLSEQRISTPASDSIADSFWTMAFFFAR